MVSVVLVLIGFFHSIYASPITLNDKSFDHNWLHNLTLIVLVLPLLACDVHKFQA